MPSESYIRTVHPHIEALHCIVVVCRLHKQDDEDISVSGIRTKKDVWLIRNSLLCYLRLGSIFFEESFSLFAEFKVCSYKLPPNSVHVVMLIAISATQGGLSGWYSITLLVHDFSSDSSVLGLAIKLHLLYGEVKIFSFRQHGFSHVNRGSVFPVYECELLRSLKSNFSQKGHDFKFVEISAI